MLSLYSFFIVSMMECSCKVLVDHIDVDIDKVQKLESNSGIVTDSENRIYGDVLHPNPSSSPDTSGGSQYCHPPNNCHFPCVNPIEFFVDPCDRGKDNCYSWQVSCLDNTGVVINYNGISDPTNTTINLQPDTTSDASLRISSDDPSTSLIFPL